MVGSPPKAPHTPTATPGSQVNHVPSGALGTGCGSTSGPRERCAALWPVRWSSLARRRGSSGTRRRRLQELVPIRPTESRRPAERSGTACQAGPVSRLKMRVDVAHHPAQDRCCRWRTAADVYEVQAGLRRATVWGGAGHAVLHRLKPIGQHFQTLPAGGGQPLLGRRCNSFWTS